MSSMHKLCKKKIKKIHILTPTINAVYKFHKKNEGDKHKCRHFIMKSFFKKHLS